MQALGARLPAELGSAGATEDLDFPNDPRTRGVGLSQTSYF